MRYHPVPIQLNEDEKIIGGKMTLKQIGFVAAGFFSILAVPFLLFFLPWYMWILPIFYIAYQTFKFTFVKKFGWAYYVYWFKLRHCKRRNNQWVYRKGRGGN